MRKPRTAMIVPIMLLALCLGREASAELGDPLPGLDPTDLQSFQDGRDAFEEVEDVGDGLGPVFNGRSCVECHSEGGTGGGSNRRVTRFGRTVRGVFDPLEAAGGSLIQSDGIGAQGACVFVGEQVPAKATVVARRRTPPLFGLGLVDAVPDATLTALAERQARVHPETAGRASQVVDLITGQTMVGRFGWKSQVGTLMHFSADAYLNEMGITTPFLPDENCPQGDCSLLACDPVPGIEDDGEDVILFERFMRFLAPPESQLFGRGMRRRALRPLRFDRRGAKLFDRIGCAECHTPTLTTGDSDVAALRRRTFHPYSDFLLHDMGRLGDGIAQGDAGETEMRTAPLWGMRAVTRFLHDGRAASITEAILAHAGQGRTARDRFMALPAHDRALIETFVGNL